MKFILDGSACCKLNQVAKSLLATNDSGELIGFGQERHDLLFNLQKAFISEDCRGIASDVVYLLKYAFMRAICTMQSGKFKLVMYLRQSLLPLAELHGLQHGSRFPNRCP